MADCLRDVVLLRLTGRNEVSILELHGLGALRTELSADDDFTTLSSVFHNETNNTVASAAHCKSADQLVAKRFGLCHGTCSTVLDALSKKFHTVLWEAVTLLHQCGEFANAAPLVAKNFPSASCANDNFSADGRHTHLYACITVLCKRPHKEFVELSVENAIGHKLTLLGGLGLRCHYISPLLPRHTALIP